MKIKLVCFVVLCCTLKAAVADSYIITEFENFNPDYTHKVVNVTLPTEVGAETEEIDPTSWLLYAEKNNENTEQGIIRANVLAPMIDSMTWATSNPSIGIRYHLYTGTREGVRIPPYEFNLVQTMAFVHFNFTLVRLKDKIASGPIILPDTTFTIINPVPNDADGEYTGWRATEWTFPFKNCEIDAPASVTLPDVTVDPGTRVVGGKTAIPVTLKNCPGAKNNIIVRLSASSPQLATKGLMNLQHSDKTSEHVFFQITNNEGEGYSLNGTTEYVVESYDGSGDYDFPLYAQWYLAFPAFAPRSPGQYTGQLTLTVSSN